MGAAHRTIIWSGVEMIADPHPSFFTTSGRHVLSAHSRSTANTASRDLYPDLAPFHSSIEAKEQVSTQTSILYPIERDRVLKVRLQVTFRRRGRGLREGTPV